MSKVQTCSCPAVISVTASKRIENSCFSTNGCLELDKTWISSSGLSPLFCRWNTSDPEKDMTVPRPRCWGTAELGAEPQSPNFQARGPSGPGSFFPRGAVQTAFLSLTVLQSCYLRQPLVHIRVVFLTLLFHTFYTDALGRSYSVSLCTCPPHKYHYRTTLIVATRPNYRCQFCPWHKEKKAVYFNEVE